MKLSYRSLLLSLAAPWVAVSAFAAEFAWTGASGDALWTNAANWSITVGDDDDGVPDEDDDVWFPFTATYGGGVLLDGNRACNSLNYSNDTSFTLGTTNDTLAITSGALGLWFINNTAEHVVACNLELNAPGGTNQWHMMRPWAYNAPARQLRIDGRVTTDGIIRFYTTNSARRGKVVFTATGHTFGGGPFIDGAIVGTEGLAWTDVFGDYPIAFGSNGSIFLRNCEQTLTNAFDTSRASGTVSVLPFEKPLTLATHIEVPSGVKLVFGTSGCTLVKLDPATTITGPGNMEIMRCGVAFTSVGQFTTGNFNIGQSGGCFIFDGISWNAFAAHYGNGYGTGNRQWQLSGGGFAAHGQAVTIDNEAAWFDRSFSLGGSHASIGDNVIRAYCDAPVILANDTTISGRYVEYSNYDSAAPGFKGTHRPAKLNRFDGSIGGAGALRFDGRRDNDEIVFAGANNSWTGNNCQTDHHGVDPATGKARNSSINSGPGGMATHQGSGLAMIVQFASPESLPRGNGGANAWLGATSRYNGFQGYLMGARTGGAVYNLAEGYRYLMGSNDGATIGLLGATGGSGESATLAGDTVCMHAAAEGQVAQLSLLVRGGAECEVGAPGSPLALAPTWGFDDGNVDNGLTGAASVVQDDATGERRLFKLGDGTAVLRNVAYTTQDGSGDTSARFIWHIGADNSSWSQSSDTRKYLPGRAWRHFPGAIRETGTDASNSTKPFPVRFLGGVIELDGVDFRRELAVAPTNGQASLQWGGGFAAHGSDATVELNGGAPYRYNDGNDGFNRADRPLVFGSRTANATVRFLNDIDFWTRTPYLVTVGGTADVPVARLEGQLSNGGFVLTGARTYLDEELPAGALELAHANNLVEKKIDIERGTLLVSGAISNGTAAVTVKAGGALGGTGVVVRPVVVEAGGTLAPGNLGVGTLAIAGDLALSEGAVYAYEESAAGRDLVKLEGGRLTLPATASVALGQKVYGRRTLVAGAGNTAGAADLSGWTVTGVEKPGLYAVELAGNDLVLRGIPPGTVFLLR